MHEINWKKNYYFFFHERQKIRIIISNQTTTSEHHFFRIFFFANQRHKCFCCLYRQYVFDWKTWYSLCFQKISICFCQKSLSNQAIRNVFWISNFASFFDFVKMLTMSSCFAISSSIELLIFLIFWCWCMKFAKWQQIL